MSNESSRASTGAGARTVDSVFSRPGLGAVLVALAVGAASEAALAQASEYFLTMHGNGSGTIFVVQNGAITRQWNGPDVAGTLFVIDTVRTAGNTGGGGEEFTLAGTPTGVTFPSPGTNGRHVDDSTTDGRFAYGWDYSTQELVRFDLDWSNPTPLFSTIPASGRTGVAYDPDGTFWTCGWLLAQIDHYSAGGVLLGSFPTTSNDDLALALDTADHTLWLVRFGTNILEQYSTSGTLLQSFAVPGLPTSISGGEFAWAPTPCPTDLDHDGTTGAADLAVLLGGWGSTGVGDVNGDGLTDASDLALLLGAWGPCS